jgi:hypothetical protein
MVSSRSNEQADGDPEAEPNRSPWFVWELRHGRSISCSVKEHATLPARVSVDHGVGVETKEEHINQAADRGCCVSACSHLTILVLGHPKG